MNSILVSSAQTNLIKNSLDNRIQNPPSVGEVRKLWFYCDLHKFPLHKICLKKQMFKSVGNDYIYQSDSSSSEVIFFKIRHFIISTFHPIFVGQKVFMRQKCFQKLKRTWKLFMDCELIIWIWKDFTVQDSLIALWSFDLHWVYFPRREHKADD